MFLNAASPRRSFNVPININLQGARRRQTRELVQPVAVSGSSWRRGGGEVRTGERTKAQVPVSSVGEDRAVLLGFTMMSFSVLMFFVVGITTVKPYINSNWEERASCVLVQADILELWVDCRGVSTVPCLQVTANISGQSVLLHYDEESVLLTPECFYTPKCQMDSEELQQEVLKVKSDLDRRLGSPLPCLTDATGHREAAILKRKYTLRWALSALLWPGLMLAGGALLVALVKLSQYLALLCSQLDSGSSEGRVPSTYAHGKLYKLLNQWSSTNSPTQDGSKW